MNLQNFPFCDPLPTDQEILELERIMRLEPVWEHGDPAAGPRVLCAAGVCGLILLVGLVIWKLI
jgi:hypothetical protein